MAPDPKGKALRASDLCFRQRGARISPGPGSVAVFGRILPAFFLSASFPNRIGKGVKQPRVKQLERHTCTHSALLLRHLLLGLLATVVRMQSIMHADDLYRRFLKIKNQKNIKSAGTFRFAGSVDSSKQTAPWSSFMFAPTRAI